MYCLNIIIVRNGKTEWHENRRETAGLKYKEKKIIVKILFMSMHK